MSFFKNFYFFSRFLSEFSIFYKKTRKKCKKHHFFHPLKIAIFDPKIPPKRVKKGSKSAKKGVKKGGSRKSECASLKQEVWSQIDTFVPDIFEAKRGSKPPKTPKNRDFREFRGISGYFQEIPGRLNFGTFFHHFFIENVIFMSISEFWVNFY